jgi:hypothetical protein
MATAMAATIPAMAAVAAAAAARARAAATVVAAAAVAGRVAAVAAIAAAAAEQTGLRLILTAHEGDPNQREKDRDTQNNNTVHPRILQLLTGTSKRENYPRCHVMRLTSPHEASERDATLRSLREFAPQLPEAPVVKLCGLRRMWRSHRLGR